MICRLFLCPLFALGALAHLQLKDPFPIRSKLNPDTPEGMGDNDYIFPLISNGLPYPCKGYLDSAASLLEPVKTWSAGSTQSFSTAGTVFHGGGSCQLSLSYDMGKTWNVIQSRIGGCMLESQKYEFTIPTAAPNGEAVFSWSWFNNLGNREMYQNCAIVTITTGGSGLNSKDHPAPFVANAGPVNTCSTAESRDVVFPNPGKNVIYSGGYKGTVPPAGQHVVGSGCAHPGGADGAGTKARAAVVPKEAAGKKGATSADQTTDSVKKGPARLNAQLQADNSPGTDGQSGTDGVFSGQGTWFDVGLGACGKTDTPDQPIVAISSDLMDHWPGATANPNLHPLCGKHLQITYRGKSIIARVADRCPSCTVHSLDLSAGLFDFFAPLSVGVLGKEGTEQMSWSWVEGSEVLPSLPYTP